MNDRDSFVSIGSATVTALDRIAECYQHDGPRWTALDGAPDLFDWAFWGRLYGPHSPGQYGLVDWGPDPYEDA